MITTYDPVDYGQDVHISWLQSKQKAIVNSPQIQSSKEAKVSQNSPASADGKAILVARKARPDAATIAFSPRPSPVRRMKGITSAHPGPAEFSHLPAQRP